MAKGNKPQVTSTAKAILTDPLGEAKDRFRVDSAGVWLWRKDPVDNTGDYRWVWLCARVEVFARTRTTDNEAWGKLLRFSDPDGKKHQWEMPEEMLMGDTRDLCKQLVSQGLKISESKKAPESLREYLHVCRPDRRARIVERIGWADKNFNTFVLPDETIPSNGAEMMLLKQTRDTTYFKRQGTLAEWKRHIGGYCSGNSRLLFAVSCAAAAPLLPLFGEQSGGFHLYATTSVGKTTILKVAGSFWGGGGPNGFVESWAITSNALENMAESHNNVLLLLDELTLSDPEQSSDVIYKISTGQAKGRMKRDTYAQRRPEWSLLLLSTGEKDVEAHTALTQKRRIYAGQEVRFCGIPAQVDEKNGAFESVHHFKSPKLFADHLKDKSDKYYGEPCREFLRQVIRAGPTKVRERLLFHRQEFLRRYLSGSEGADVARAGDRFAFVASCGELATELDS